MVIEGGYEFGPKNKPLSPDDIVWVMICQMITVNDLNSVFVFLLYIEQKLKCGCGEVTEKETCVSLNETVPLPTGGGMHTLYRRFWEHNGS
nr:UPF0587 protein C1orf123 homolog [Ipomoea batatas]